jgi:hypothetical protein
LFNVYWNRFGCEPYDFIGDKEVIGKKAGQCAIERMADMKYRISKNLPIDVGHLQPIKLAYEMGKSCLKDSLKYNPFVSNFRIHYKDLIKDHPYIHDLIQLRFGIGEYPFEFEDKIIQLRMESMIRKNPILYLNNKNKTKKNKNIKNHNKKENTKNNHKNILTYM